MLYSYFSLALSFAHVVLLALMLGGWLMLWASRRWMFVFLLVVECLDVVTVVRWPAMQHLILDAFIVITVINHGCLPMFTAMICVMALWALKGFNVLDYWCFRQLDGFPKCQNHHLSIMSIFMLYITSKCGELCSDQCTHHTCLVMLECLRCVSCTFSQVYCNHITQALMPWSVM